MKRGLTILLALVVAVTSVAAQTRPAAKKPAKKTAGAAKAAGKGRTVTAPADVACPEVLGTGQGSKLVFCDVMTGRDPAAGVLITLPPHKGALKLTFDLHNRHTYSEEMVQSGRGYTGYTATIGILTADRTLLDRGVVSSEFRTSKDLFDRIGGGAGPGGMKAVAPIGSERIVVDVPEGLTQVSLLGERLVVSTLNGTETFTGPQRPIAAVSNVTVEYTPAPAKRPAKAAKTAKATKKTPPPRSSDGQDS